MRKIVVCLCIMSLLVVVAAVVAQEPTQIDPYSLSGRQYKLVINRLLQHALDCYSTELQENPELAGKLKIKVSLDAAGKVTGIDWLEDSLGNKKVSECIGSLFTGATWPKSDGPVYFYYTFTFAPSAP